MLPLNNVFNNVRTEAYHGAQLGLFAGLTVLSTPMAGAMILVPAETFSRIIGNPPQWPVFSEDCQLDVFTNSSHYCDSWLASTSTSYLAGSVLVVSTVGGAILGALSGVKNSLL